MKCQNCGHDVEVLNLDRSTVQTLMLRDPCCEEPDYSVTDEEVFEYLDELRSAGVINMLGAGTYIKAEFKLSGPKATKVLADWMRTFHERHQEDGP